MAIPKKKWWAVVVNYTRGQIRLESPPPSPPEEGWEILYKRPTQGEATELMRAMAPVLKPEIVAAEAAVAMA